MSQNGKNESGGRRMTVLLIEDMEIVRKMVFKMLGQIGWEVITASDGREGYEIFMKNADDIDLMIFDLSMPVMDGRQIYAKVRELKSNLPIIIVSGYPIDEDDDRMIRQDPCSEYLQKPFSLEDIEQKIRLLIGKC